MNTLSIKRFKLKILKLTQINVAHLTNWRANLIFVLIFWNERKTEIFNWLNKSVLIDEARKTHFSLDDSEATICADIPQ